MPEAAESTSGSSNSERSTDTEKGSVVLLTIPLTIPRQKRWTGGVGLDDEEGF